MKLQIFSVHDSKAEAFLTPFFAPTLAVAKRDFSTACSDQGHAFNRNAGDYTLFHLGDFDQDTATLTKLDTPENLGLALSYIMKD